ncbi:aminopeptidase NAALADL1-like isoform X2 [Amblyomma americanum]
MTDDEKEVKIKSTATAGHGKACAAGTLAVLAAAVVFLLVGHYVLPPFCEQRSTKPNDCLTAQAETKGRQGEELSSFRPTNNSATCTDGSCSNDSAVLWENAHGPVDTDIFTKEIQDESLEEHIRVFAQEPHVAGSPREEHVLAQYLADRLSDYGFDEVRLQPYHVLLSYPNASDPNTVQLVNVTTGEVLLEAASHEERIEGLDTDVGPAFLAYSPPGDVLGCLVYVNRATHEDLDDLETLNVSIAGCLCIARNAGSTLASKAYSCARKGGVGLLVFPDPSSRTRKSGSPLLFPAGPRMPDSVLRRDTMMHVGDPLTPGVPAIPSAERMDPAFAGLPPIPSQSISCRDAQLLLRTLEGPDAPGHFQLLENVTYKLGGGSNDRLVRLRVNNLFTLALINDVIAKMHGAVEPDRYVVVGAQRDSFGFGALHPAPSTASLLALGQALGSLKKRGLRPRRSIILGSWGAGEYGQVGSTEWVEEHLFELQSRAIAYIDISECASGGLLFPKAWPTLENLAVEAASRVWDTREANMTVADLWRRQEKGMKSSSESNLWPEEMDAASDTAPFSLYAGVPSLSFLFRPGKITANDDEATYPAHHTAYDTLLLYHNWTDPRLTPMCARLHGAATWLAANAPLVTTNFSALGRRLEESLSVLRSAPTALQLELNGVSLDPLRLAIDRFRKVADQWTEYVALLNKTRATDLRFLNDQMMLAEQAFLKTTGLPGRPLTRHLLWAPSEFDRHRITGFPVFADLLFYISQLPPETRDQGWKNVRFYLADVLVALRSAGAALRIPAL